MVRFLQLVRTAYLICSGVAALDVREEIKVAVRNIGEEAAEHGVYHRRLIQHHVNCRLGQHGSEAFRIERMPEP